MIDLRTLLDEDLATRRALGVRLEAPERYLKRFVTVVGECGAVFITTELALQWATEPSHVQSAQWAKRLGCATDRTCPEKRWRTQQVQRAREEADLARQRYMQTHPGDRMGRRAGGRVDEGTPARDPPAALAAHLRLRIVARGSAGTAGAAAVRPHVLRDRASGRASSTSTTPAWGP